MIPLGQKNFPSSKDELAQALDAALRRFVKKTGPVVDVRSRVFPYLDEIAINLDGAQFVLPAPSLPVSDTKPAFEAGLVTLSGRNVSVQGVPMDLRMEARDMLFDKGEDANGEAVLLPHQSRDGQLVISAAQLNLEEAIEQIAQREGHRHGVTIEQVRLAMRARGPRSLAADVHVLARKFLLRARIDISSQLDIDQEFVAKISQLKCRSDGALGSLACNALEPFFSRITGKAFPLNSLALGELQLRDIHLAVADTVELTIDFGSASA